MNDNKKEFLKVFSLPFWFIIFLWAVKLTEVLFNISFSTLGIYPGKMEGLPGIIFSPLLHADFEHLIANTIPLLLLGTGILYFYKKASKKVLIIIYIIPGLLVWFLGRPAYHIGASGLIYGFTTFIFFSGIFRRDNRSIALALIVTFLYGSLVWGILPLKENISWESHLFGSITGVVSAFFFRKSDPPKKYDWEDEEEDYDPKKLEINYKK